MSFKDDDDVKELLTLVSDIKRILSRIIEELEALETRLECNKNARLHDMSRKR